MYIVIEKFPSWNEASIVTDKHGINQVFNTIEEAQSEADECQDGVIVGDEGNETLVSTFVNDLHQIHSLLEEGLEMEAAKNYIKGLIQQLKT